MEKSHGKAGRATQICGGRGLGRRLPSAREPTEPGRGKTTSWTHTTESTTRCATAENETGDEMARRQRERILGAGAHEPRCFGKQDQEKSWRRKTAGNGNQEERIELERDSTGSDRKMQPTKKIGKLQIQQTKRKNNQYTRDSKVIFFIEFLIRFTRNLVHGTITLI
jgi:hypothetical protein